MLLPIELREQAAHEIDGAGGDDEAAGWRDLERLGESGGEVRGGVGRHVQTVGGGEELIDRGGTRVVDGGEDDVVAAAIRIAGGGVEEREEDLRHAVEVLVGEAGEEEGTGQGGGQLGDGRAEGPGACRVVRDVEQEGVAGAEKGDELEPAGPEGCTNALADRGVRDLVTFLVT